jgi:hypothetical protein
MEATDQLESIQPIAEEQPEVPPSIPVEETEARPPKKKKLSEDRLTKLAKARARASQVAKEKRERKTRPSDDPIVVVEQDESDEDVFEAPPGVLFVRRKRAKKPEPPPSAPAISPEMQILYASMFGSRSF